MSMKDAIESVKKKIEKIKRNHQFSRANRKRDWEAKLTKELMDCAGDLGVCRGQYEIAIRRQSEEIREGLAKGYPVAIQKNLLMNAAVGYLVVKDALFVIRSVSTYDSIENAYALLDMATKTITGEKVKKPKIGKHPTREEYAFINSFETLEAKEKIVNSNGFMEMLIATGNIEKCMAAAQEKIGTEPEQYETVVPLEPQLEKNDTPTDLSPEEMKTLKMMQQSSNWSNRQSFSMPIIGTDTQPPAAEASAENNSENKTGGTES